LSENYQTTICGKIAKQIGLPCSVHGAMGQNSAGACYKLLTYFRLSDVACRRPWYRK